MKNLILISLFSLLLACACSKDKPVSGGNNSGDNNPGDNNGNGGGGPVYVKPRIVMEFTSVPANVSSSGESKITGLITPYFNANLGEFPATVADITVRRDTSDDSNDKPRIPSFLTICYATNKFKIYKALNITKDNSNLAIEPYKIVENSKTSIQDLYAVSTDVMSGKEYRSETTFNGGYQGSTLIIKFYAVILSKKQEILAKSQELNRTYVVQ